VPVGAQLSHRCTILRGTFTTDAYGARVEAFAPVAEGVPCRLVQRLVTAPEGLLAERPIVTRTTLLVLPQADVRETDRISGVVYEDGARDPGVYVVRDLVARRRGRHGLTHLSAEIERVGATTWPPHAFGPPLTVGLDLGTDVGVLEAIALGTL
jgi:hypothetical protein